MSSLSPSSQPGYIPVEERMPPDNVRVVVKTELYRCLAYHDGQGTWLHDSNGKPVPHVLGWIENPF